MGNAYVLEIGKLILTQSEKKYISRVLLNVEIVLIAKIEQLTKQKKKLFHSLKLDLGEKGTGDANENASLKNDIIFIMASFIYAK